MTNSEAAHREWNGGEVGAAERLAAEVRARLEAAGHSATRFEDKWIRSELVAEGGTRQVVRVPIVHGWNLTLHPTGMTEQAPDDVSVSSFAADVAAALPSIRREGRRLARRLGTIARVSHELSAATNAKGSMVRADLPAPVPIHAASLANYRGLEALRSVRIAQAVTGLDVELEAETRMVEVDRAEELAIALGSWLDEQPERHRRFLLSRAPGPHVQVDALTVELIEAGGLDPVEVMRRFTRTWQTHVDVVWNDQPRRIFLVSHGSLVESQMCFDEGRHHTYWHARVLAVENSRRKARAARPGASAASIVDHPAFRERTIVSVEPGWKGGSCLIRLDEPLLDFDADVGTFT